MNPTTEGQRRLLLLLLAVLLRSSTQSVSSEQTIHNNDVTDHGPSSASDDEEDTDIMVIEDFEEETNIEERNVFVPTREWQVVEEGQSIPPGLHVRMNLQTGLKEAKLLDDDDEDKTDSERKMGASDEHNDGDSNGGERASQESPSQTSTDIKFTGDKRRTHYFGKSDRRGIVNKKTKVFSRKELLEALNEEEDGKEHMLLTAQGSQEDEVVNIHTTSHRATFESGEGPPVSVSQEPSRRRSDLPYTLHEDVGMMLEHSQTLANKDATIQELVHALEELEYHVHNLDNAKDLNTIGGLVLVMRQLNHSSPEVRSHAAHVIGSASQRYCIRMYNIQCKVDIV